MGRIILFAIICASAYWFLKKHFGNLISPQPGSSPGDKKRPAPITDELVKDPVCGVYCPKREALQMFYKGKLYCFCSKECKKKFLEHEKDKGI